MTRKDKEAVIAALEEYKGDCIGMIAATIEDCQRVVREMAEDNGWVPATERLPDTRCEKTETDGDDEISYELSDYVLGLDRHGIVQRVQFERGPVYTGWHDDPGTTHKITHWMPLPEPPKEVRNG